VSSFELLHPVLQHHIVNSLGWRELRPLQEASIGPILKLDHVLLLAPTAGGKTESAFFPVLSRMLAEKWTGLSVLYICPLKALLNNLHQRLDGYCGWAERRCELWHGDVSQTERRAILKELPDCLLTTPESLEVMLVSPKTDKRFLFGKLQVVIIDEIHAFAGDDRGWHLLSVLERLRHIAGRELQRVGLSATVGNPEGLLNWLAGHCPGVRQVVQVPASGAVVPEVQVDYVGSLENAAIVISRLYQGQKRLVFCDSRSRVEKLASRLREAGVETHVSHSSLSLEERRRSEKAFAESSNCVIVSTSTLELGIDVGDLDRVIQIDAPATVASFLQRLGRSGRRSGTSRNCLFLATHSDALLRAIAIVNLWKEGFVEPIVAPPLPYHIFAQQLLALSLQERGVGRKAWPEWLFRLPPFNQAGSPFLEKIVEYMLQRGFMAQDQGILCIGNEGERTFGYQNFLDLFSVFMRAPEFEVFYGREHLGSVDRGTFSSLGGGAQIVSLAGRSWRVREIDWNAWKAFVEPTEFGGRSRWIGSGRAYGYELCQMVLRILASEERLSFVSQRAEKALEDERSEFAWARPETTFLEEVSEEDQTLWWTFAGRKVNDHLGRLLTKVGFVVEGTDNLRLVLQGRVDVENFKMRLGQIQTDGVLEGNGAWVEEIEALKFSECLPDSVRTLVVARRACAEERVLKLFKLKVVCLTTDG
jgi:ATP-dependent helicase Lhr and Lhr-like helicase